MKSSLGYDCFDRYANEGDLLYCCNAVDGAVTTKSGDYITTVSATSSVDSLSSAMDDLRDQFEMLKESITASSGSVDNFRVGLEKAVDKMQDAGRVFKTHLKRSDLNHCF